MDQPIQRPDCRTQTFDPTGYLLCLGQIEHFRTMSASRKIMNSLVKPLLASTNQDNSRTQFTEQTGSFPANTGRCPGDKESATGQVQRVFHFDIDGLCPSLFAHKRKKIVGCIAIAYILWREHNSTLRIRKSHKTHHG
jgi:hypothetical protein